MDDGTVDLEMDRAHSARMYDYFLGGVTNFPADREAAARALVAFPSAPVAARVNRRFMQRSTRALAQQGMTQFLDIGTGIPTSPNLHEVAQSITPSARVVYADNDPIVLAHARALLHSHPDGMTAYHQGDITEPAALLAHPTLSVLDFGRPIALSLNAVLHFVPGDDRAHDIVEHLKGALPSGSTLAISHFTAAFDPEGTAHLIKSYTAAGTPVQARTREEFERFFTGWDLLDPGVVTSHHWRPDPGDDVESITDAEVSCHAAIARKP
ncbi:SAM-dependent methyltransferase [Streptomyces sp. NPDC004838]